MRKRARSLAGALLLAAAGAGGCAGLEPPPTDLAIGEGALQHAEWTVDEPGFDEARVPLPRDRPVLHLARSR
jgi:hypothetical protein